MTVSKYRFKQLSMDWMIEVPYKPSPLRLASYPNNSSGSIIWAISMLCYVAAFASPNVCKHSSSYSMMERVTMIVCSIDISWRSMLSSLSLKCINSFDVYVVNSFWRLQRSRCSIRFSTSLFTSFSTLRIKQIRRVGILKRSLMRDYICRSSFSNILKPIKAIYMQSWILLNLTLADSCSWGIKCYFSISVHLTSAWLTTGFLVKLEIKSW